MKASKLSIGLSKHSVLIIFMLCSFVSFSQQDKHFSMFFESKSQINPATAGFFDGDYQLFTNYRNQWAKKLSQPFKTFSAAFDGRYKTKNGFLGYGFNVYKDVSGKSGFTVNQVSIPINYAVRINKNNFFSLGITPMFYQRNIKNKALNWQTQWTGTGYNTSIGNGENFINQNYGYGKVDIGAGLYWYSNLTKYKWFGIGLSAHHLISPKTNAIAINDGLYRRFAVSFFGNFGSQYSNLTIKPNLLVSLQGPNSNIVIGSGFDFQLKTNSLYTGYHHKNSIEFGSYYRVKDAIILNTVVHLSSLSIGLSYDINISSLKQVTNSFGALEFFVAYKIQKLRGRGALKIH